MFVFGDGFYEWDGYLLIIVKFNVFDLVFGIFYIVNVDVMFKDYEYMNVIGFFWFDLYW